MDCKTTRALLELFPLSSAELQDPDRAEIELHLASCTECDHFVRAQQKIDHHLGKAIRHVPVPHGLKKRILTAVGEQKTEKKRRRTFRAAGVMLAATLLLAVGYWIFLRPAPLPELNPEEVSRELAMLEINRGKSQAEEYYALKGIPVEAPDRLDYRYLAFYNIAEISGRKVPHLVLIRGASRLEVYIFSNREFDLRNLPDGYNISSSGKNVEIWREGNYASFVVYADGELQKFRKFLD